ncbi:Hypothetical predicted protein [Mytilus galloprovincialis]|uniref:Integrase zinc-binding domain-containing protein n=1 Tax=Mytilus galloprovincialis TaxID=29158 RepID=A0A8B6CKJ1_MYTGA|nr:Hypothetical predicted protein [Mytilus galloprovincialis]
MNRPFIKADHPKALDDFAIFLQECMYAVNYVDAAKVLEYSENLKLLIQKLPFYMQEKWRNVVYETKSRKNIVTFSHLVEFVKKDSKKANDPVYGKDVLNTQVGKNVKRLQDNNMNIDLEDLKRLLLDETFRDEYVTFMNKVIGDGFATEVSIDDLAKKDNDVWFLPHHGVFHPRKKKIRVVFDCAAKFQDASESGYGTVTYLRLENTFDEIHCSFVMGKARVTPLKTITVPRLELTAATVAVRTNKMLLNELEIPIDGLYFGPTPSSENHGTICADDPEVRQATVRTIIKTEIPDNSSLGVEKLIAYFSSWMSLKRSVAWILKIRKELLRRVSNKKQDNKMTLVKESDSKDYTKRISLQDLKDAEHSILVYVQRQEFTDEINTLSGNKTVKATSNIRKLDPVLDGDLLRVGGRLIKSKMPEKCKHPIILPKGHHISELILRQIHMDLQHSGRNHLLAHLRETYWLINAPSAVRKLISKCVVCRRLSAPVGEQKMANLPSDRITPDEPPFSRVGVDYFGPFEVKQRRCRIKRYGAIFTCLSSRAIHLEVAASLDTSSYINVLRRFIARRGQVEKIRSDNGTNFVGAERELKKRIK